MGLGLSVYAAVSATGAIVTCTLRHRFSIAFHDCVMSCTEILPRRYISAVTVSPSEPTPIISSASRIRSVSGSWTEVIAETVTASPSYCDRWHERASRQSSPHESGWSAERRHPAPRDSACRPSIFAPRSSSKILRSHGVKRVDEHVGTFGAGIGKILSVRHAAHEVLGVAAVHEAPVHHGPVPLLHQRRELHLEAAGVAKSVRARMATRVRPAHQYSARMFVAVVPVERMRSTCTSRRPTGTLLNVTVCPLTMRTATLPVPPIHRNRVSGMTVVSFGATVRAS